MRKANYSLKIRNVHYKLSSPVFEQKYFRFHNAVNSFT